MAIHFKTYLNHENIVDIKRFSLNVEDAKCFDKLKKTIDKLYPNFLITSLKYQDHDEDYVTISSSSDIIEALDFMSGETMKIYLTGEKNSMGSVPEFERNSDVKDIREDDTNIKDNNTHETLYHPNIICDGCDGHIYGIRYKCSVCYDYDLCSNCEAQNVHADHPLLKISKPIKKFHSKFRYGASHNQDHNSFESGNNNKKYGEQRGCPFNRNASFYHGQYCKHRDNFFRKNNCGDKNGMFSSFKNFVPPAFSSELPSQSPPFTANYWTTFMKNLGQGLNTLFDPLGIDVNVDINGYENSGTSTPPQSQPSESQEGKDASGDREKSNKERSNNDNKKQKVYEGIYPGGSSSLKDFLENNTTLFTPNIKININGTDVLASSFAKYNSAASNKDNENLDASNVTTEKGEEAFDSNMNSSQYKDDNDFNNANLELDKSCSDKSTVATDSDVKEIAEKIKTEMLIEDETPGISSFEKIFMEEPNPSETWDLLENDDIVTISSRDDDAPGIKENSIDDALVSLEAMGYVNEGGWLTYLLNMKNGDINKVLDIIHPN